MNIRSCTMLGTDHSWSVVMRNILLQFRRLNHNLYLKSTNGTSLIPKELMVRLDKELSNPDIDICYTLPRNFESRFRKSSKNKMAIYNYETDILPEHWKGSHRFVDFVLPSSNFSKEVFTKAGWPEEKCIVVPHGINIEDFKDNSEYRLSSGRRFKFLNISIPHYRKNIDVVLNAYYSAFSDQDDTCLVLKTKLEPSKRKYQFEVNVRDIIISAQKRHMGRPGGLPSVEVVRDRLPSMTPLYNACDALVSASSSEGFGMPMLEALAAKKLVIAPRCTGQLDFLNDSNSLLCDVSEIEADARYQYWIPSEGAKTFIPKQDHLAELMLSAYKSKDLFENFRDSADKTVNEFTWENAARKILELS